MAITKTDFVNYTRCRRYVALEEIRKDKLTSGCTLEEYKKQEIDEEIKDILGGMFSIDAETEEDIDLTVKEDKQLNAMMEYYKEVEILAALEVERVFGGKSTYSKDTFMQESFDADINGIKYLCYVDIYNESNDAINIIEVKLQMNVYHVQHQWIIVQHVLIHLLVQVVKVDYLLIHMIILVKLVRK